VAEHVYRTRVAWSDTDASGRIHFTAPFRWAENAEHELRRELAVPLGSGSLPRRHVEADYLRALSAGDEIELHLRVEALGHTSITFAWKVLSGGERCVEGRHVAVWIDPSGAPQPLPDAARRLLA